MSKPKKNIVATIHQELMEGQRAMIDAYMEDYQVFTRTAVVDEALAEFFAKRRRDYPRSHGQKSGSELFTGQNRRRSDQRIAG